MRKLFEIVSGTLIGAGVGMTFAGVPGGIGGAVIGFLIGDYI